MKSAPVLETALAVGAYAEENRMGGGARGQVKKTVEPTPLASLGSRRLEPGAGVGALGYGIVIPYPG